ncbi:DUF6314 family protein [Roseibacterium sp. SDUM158016]|uniref:DUF6314 family protein n=1 Tax=Roseicyclus sediminis TaxID=2980997 RepID=UPI0021D14E2F|nr:DUF6314 family protein [Roseibacterium sp. SDUM158016]MCU4655134.1 DUF6314 family protein [Roseibacterium sp. SDUM158016]
MIGLSDLEGRWLLGRVIEDRRAGLTGRLEGTATWAPDGVGLVQVEKGLLRYGDAPPMQAERRYLWRAAGEGLEVLFEDGRPFHVLAPGRLSDTHLCAPDTYVMSYVFGDGPGFATVCEVRGPRKDMRIESRYSPL